MRPLLGTVDRTGVLRFSGDLNDCRDFLRRLGLQCPSTGWEGNGYRGLIEWWQGRHHAAAWRIR